MSESTSEDYTGAAGERSRSKAWQRARDYSDETRRAAARAILRDLQLGSSLRAALHHHPAQGSYLSKDSLIHAYREMLACGEISEQPGILRALRAKPVRTLSGVATVSVLTKPYPCPGSCLFCPTDARMPKSYLADEPGAMRGAQHAFDPYAQTAARLESLQAVGHPTDKVELLILGGTWSAYPRDYQAWFVHRCLDALNGFPSRNLSQAQAANAAAPRRNVGLVIETRPDHINADELRWLRQLGVTKLQIGVQSLDDRLLQLNKRGHTVAQTRQALRLVRAAGFKIHVHWMPNLLGADLAGDRRDFGRLWADEDIRPDELKIYPTSLVRESALYACWQRGEYHPYSTEDLVALLVALKPTIPRYCRVSRLARDIPAHHVVEGNRRSNLREDAQRELAARGLHCQCIRCRELRARPFVEAGLALEDLVYSAGGAEEHFLSLDSDDGSLVGYLRLSLPGPGSPPLGWPDLAGAAIIRELHVYGQSMPLGQSDGEAAQHRGLGAKLIARSEVLSRERGFERLAVISALGTRGYYAAQGFLPGELYQVKLLT